MLLSNGTIAPTTLADSSPTTSNPNYYPQGGMGLVNQFATYGQIYRSQVWVATLVNKLAFSVARLPLKSYIKIDSGREPADSTPYGKLLANPNSRHDPFFFWLWTWSTFEVFGEAIWVKVRPKPGAPPSALLPLHPSNVFTKINQSDGSLIYVYHIGSASQPVLQWPEADIVHFRSYNPDNQVRGLSRLEPLRQSLQTDDAIRRAQGAWYKHGARPSAYLTHPKTLSDDAGRRLKGQWDSVHSGIDNWGKTAILEEGMTANILQLDAQQMELIASLKMSREDACAVYDVPPPAVHILDHATFSNITEQMRSLYRDTMAPRLGLIESVLDVQLRPEFGDNTLYAEFLMDEVLRGDFEARAASYDAGIRSAWLMPGEARKLENLPDAGPDTHRLYVNSATVPLGTAAGANPVGQEVEIKPQIIKALSSASVRSLMGRIGRMDGSDPVALIDPDRFLAGLNGDTPTAKAILDRAALADQSVGELRAALTSEEP